jgi:hypothetical protein
MSLRTKPFEPLYSNLVYCTAFGIDYVRGGASIYAFAEKAYQIKGRTETWLPFIQGSRMKSLEHDPSDSQAGFNSTALLQQIKLDSGRAVFVVIKEELDGCSDPIKSLKKAGFTLTAILTPSNNPGIEKAMQQLKEGGFFRVVKLTKLEDLPVAVLNVMTGQR